jgi:hypothetical protein
MVPGGGIGSVGMYQLAALIEAEPRISLSRCTVKMHQRPTHQKSSGNGKSLLQIHVSTTRVGMNHPLCLRIYTQAVTQIRSQDR